jgi:bifunctional lysine-specific demethylase and histidyl-hydroxylase NO66
MPTTTRPTRTRTAPTPDTTAADSSLGRCVGPVDDFLRDRFTRAPHIWRGEDFADLLSISDVDAQLSAGGLRRPAVRVVRDGELVDPASWTRGVRTGAVHVDDLVHPGKVFELFADGATVVLQSLQRWWAPLVRFCREMESVLGHAVQANAYLTPPAAAGFTPHHDTHDVFVLQVHGAKHWTIREPILVDPIARHRSDHEAAAARPVSFEIDLSAGDCLYLPRGHIHSASTQEGPSLHITVGVLATTVHDVLRRLVERAADDEPSFRRTLGTIDTPGSGRESLGGIITCFVEWLESLDLDDAGVAALLSRGARRAPLLDGQLLELVGLESIDDSTMLRRRAWSPLAVRATEGTVELDLGDRTVELPGVLQPAVALVLDGDVHAVAELGTYLDESSRLVLARRLVREGVLRTSDGT